MMMSMKKLLQKVAGVFGGSKAEPVLSRARLSLDPAGYAAIYAIGDIHGCLSQLLALEDKIRADGPADALKLVILLGDYVDRGPKSREVIEHLIEPSSGFERVALCGNHDDAFLQFARSPAKNLGWLEFGGMETLRSYGIDARHILKSGGGMPMLARAVAEVVPETHLDFVAALPIALMMGDYLFVHAGIKPGLRLEEQIDQDLMWMREPFLTQGPRLPLTVVHGHTAGNEPVFSPSRICLDTGAYATGKLTALRILEGELATLTS
jgi:serine/threonine protein phosphatase 1